MARCVVGNHCREIRFWLCGGLLALGVYPLAASAASWSTPQPTGATQICSETLAIDASVTCFRAEGSVQQFALAPSGAAVEVVPGPGGGFAKSVQLRVRSGFGGGWTTQNLPGRPWYTIVAIGTDGTAAAVWMEASGSPGRPRGRAVDVRVSIRHGLGGDWSKPRTLSRSNMIIGPKRSLGFDAKTNSSADLLTYVDPFFASVSAGGEVAVAMRSEVIWRKTTFPRGPGRIRTDVRHQCAGEVTWNLPTSPGRWTPLQSFTPVITSRSQQPCSAGHQPAGVAFNLTGTAVLAWLRTKNPGSRIQTNATTQLVVRTQVPGASSFGPPTVLGQAQSGTSLMGTSFGTTVSALTGGPPQVLQTWTTDGSIEGKWTPATSPLTFPSSMANGFATISAQSLLPFDGQPALVAGSGITYLQP